LGLACIEVHFLCIQAQELVESARRSQGMEQMLGLQDKMKSLESILDSELLSHGATVLRDFDTPICVDESE
jgi:hypothetical protein